MPSPVPVVDEDELEESPPKVKPRPSKPSDVLVGLDAVSVVDEDELEESPPKVKPRPSRPSDVLVGLDAVSVVVPVLVEAEVEEEDEESLSGCKIEPSPPSKPSDEVVVVADVAVSVVSVDLLSTDFVSTASLAGCELPGLVVVEPSESVVEPRRPSNKSSSGPFSVVVVDDKTLVLVSVGLESAVVVAVTAATVASEVVVTEAPVATPVLAVPVIVCVLPLSSTERVIGTITTSGSSGCLAEVVVVVVVSGSCSSLWLKIEPNQFFGSESWPFRKEPNWRLSCL